MKLTKALFKQFRAMSFDDVRPFLSADGNEDPSKIIGWVCGSVLGDDYVQWLIFDLGNGQYGRFNAMSQTCKKYPQIYV